MEQNTIFTNIFIDIISKIVLPLILPYGAYKIYPIDNTHKKEKNQFFRHIKANSTIYKTSQKIDNLKYVKSDFFLITLIGIFTSIVYILILLPLIILYLDYISQTDFTFFSYLSFDTNQQLIFGVHLNMMLIPILFLSGIFLRHIKKRNQLDDIETNKKYSESFKPKFNDEMKLTRKSKLFLYIFPYLIGIIISVNLIIYSYLYSTIKSMIDQPLEFTFESLRYLYFVVANSFPNNWEIIIYVYSISLGLSIIFSVLLYQTAMEYLELAKIKIIDYYSEDFPLVYIKTPSGEITGKIKDIFNDNLLILKENGIKKIISWKNIEILEIPEEQ